MLMPASAEFVALCQAQVTLLTQSLGAALSIVYLTEELTEVADAKLVPVVAYPEAIATWGEDQILSLLSRGQRRSNPRLLSARTISSSNPASLTVLPAPNESVPPLPLQAAEQALLRQQQLVLPLIHEEMVMGLLVTARSDRAWSEAEQTQLKQVAQTLAVACVLDQRSQWMAQDLHQQEMQWDQRQDLFDDLLHQFRNPLTALRTFGKLLLRRLQPGDTNHPVADGIVRESDRLEDLLKQLDIAADLNDLKLLPAQPASVGLLPESLTGAACQLEPHAIIEVLEPLLESAEAIAQDRQLTLQSKIPAHLPPVQTDVKMLREVLSNLVDNALKYTPAGGGVWVQVEDQGKMQAIVIADTGAGIPPPDLPRLFERHYRGVQAKTAIPGSGLGLAIARELLHAMQADIEIFSPATTCGLLPADYPVTGTAVVVWLPTA
jgi:signal transduction histidine kinase